MDQLLGELAGSAPVDVAGARSTLGEQSVMAGLFGPEDEWLVRSFREFLARIAATLYDGREDPPLGSVEAALDGAEMVMRGELASGGAARLPRLLPSFVFLVTLPIVDQDRALALSRRTTQLIEEQVEES
jgi:hypothetical protein